MAPAGRGKQHRAQRQGYPETRRVYIGDSRLLLDMNLLKKEGVDAKETPLTPQSSIL